MSKKISFLAFALAIFLLGALASQKLLRPDKVVADNLRSDDQDLTIRAIGRAMPAVVSIVIYNWQDRLIVDAKGGTTSTSTRSVRGNGTGFLVSSDGYILTNKHVATVSNPKTAEYKIKLASGKEYYGQFIGSDPINDLAILKIFDKNLPAVTLAKTSKLPVGTTVMAIGNVLGKYSNTVTKGIIAGRGRSLVAYDNNGGLESLENMIQTDAQINEGNSGGPLINLQGEVVGINVAMDNGGQGIGFAIPVDDARPVIDSVKKYNRIIRARLGLRYIMINPSLVAEKNLKQDSGALVTKGKNGEAAIAFVSPAMKAGFQEGDIITQVNDQKLDSDNSLMSAIQAYRPGDKVKLKFWRNNKLLEKEVILDEFKL